MIEPIYEIKVVGGPIITIIAVNDTNGMRVNFEIEYETDCIVLKPTAAVTLARAILRAAERCGGFMR